SRLVGAPPGYVGYEEGGQLTEKVRRKPYSIVLLDEIEKAHPDVFNLLLQVLDDGHMTDGLGRKIDFKNTILIMTSNIGARQLADFGTGVGFGTKSQQESRDENSKAVIQNALRKAFSPEFLNRVDDMIMFKSLGREEIHKIIDLELDKLYKRINNLGYLIELTEKAKDFIVDKGYDEKFGARPLKRAIQKYIEDPLAEEIIKANLSDGDNIIMDIQEGKDELSLAVKKAKSSKKSNTTEE
ncbi:MAG: AAA family ATPase, partial [Crocinitomicaceae bacterium]